MNAIFKLKNSSLLVQLILEKKYLTRFSKKEKYLTRVKKKSTT